MTTRYVDVDAEVGGDGTTAGLTGGTCAYKSQNIAEAALPATLTDAWEIICGSAHANHTADSTATIFNGTTTSEANYIDIYASVGSRHAGVWSDSKYRLKVSGSHCLDIYNFYVRIDYLQVELTSTAGNLAAINLNAHPSSAANEIRITNCLLRGVVSGGSGTACAGIRVYESNFAATVLKCWNCISYNFYNSTYPNDSSNVGYVNLYGVATFQNCTAYRCGTGYKKNSTYSITCTNCLSVGNAVNANYIDFSGTITQSYNISSDTTSDGTGSIDSQSLTDIDFISTTAGSEDLHIQSTSTAVGAGTDLSGSFTLDIDGETRVAWDIGADEYIAAGGGGNPWYAYAQQ